MVQSVNNIIQKLFTYKIVRYGFVGGISTFIHFLFAFLYIYYINTSVFQSNVLGFLVAYVFSYFMQSKFVFEHNVNIEKAIKYFIVQFGALLMAIMLSNVFEYNSYIKTAIVIVLLPLITFVIHKFWTFKKETT